MPQIKLANGARILELSLTGAESFDGFVLARTEHGEFVTWRVQALSGDSALHAFSGDYFGSNLELARANYDKRRGIVRKGN